MKKLMAKYFPTDVSKKQVSDTGMAFVLISLLIGFFTKNIICFKLAIPLLIINMTFPMFYYPFSIVWLGVTTLIGSVVSKIILSIVYIVFVIPVAITRRLMGKDSLSLTGFKKNKSSVMITRDHCFSSKDIENPY